MEKTSIISTYRLPLTQDISVYLKKPAHLFNYDYCCPFRFFLIKEYIHNKHTLFSVWLTLTLMTETWVLNYSAFFVLHTTNLLSQSPLCWLFYISSYFCIFCLAHFKLTSKKPLSGVIFTFICIYWMIYSPVTFSRIFNSQSLELCVHFLIKMLS